MNSERPLEPNNRGENPEGWAELVDWEADRADQLERELTAARAEIARLQEDKARLIRELTKAFHALNMTPKLPMSLGFHAELYKHNLEVADALLAAIDAARKSP